MADFFSNNWVVSILTGIIVYVLTKLWETIKEKKWYLNTLKIANGEVFNTIKLMIPESELPTSKILFSLHRATAKKHSVKQEDMDELPIIIDGLIKEILDSSFLSYHDKTNYTNKLLALSEKIQTNSEGYNEVLLNNSTKSNLKNTFAVILSVISTFLVLVYRFFTEDKTVSWGNGVSELAVFTLIATVTILIIAMVDKKLKKFLDNQFSKK